MSIYFRNWLMIKDIKDHWDYVHTDQSRTFSKISAFFSWRQNYEFFSLCKKYLQEQAYGSIFEIWCAPGNFLISFYKKYWYIPSWIDYSEQWVSKTKKNFDEQWIPGNIRQQDFFNDEFIENNKEKFDVVFSLWFIEHYDDPSDAIQRHFDLTKPWWLVIITIPNLHWLNSIFVPKDIIDLHNVGIMNKISLEKLFSSYTTLHIERIWGPLNVGLYFYKNKLQEIIRLLIFGVQRIIIDPFLILLYILWIKLNRNSSPQRIIICKK